MPNALNDTCTSLGGGGETNKSITASKRLVEILNNSQAAINCGDMSSIIEKDQKPH